MFAALMILLRGWLREDSQDLTPPIVYEGERDVSYEQTDQKGKFRQAEDLNSTLHRKRQRQDDLKISSRRSKKLRALQQHSHSTLATNRYRFIDLDITSHNSNPELKPDPSKIYPVKVLESTSDYLALASCPVIIYDYAKREWFEIHCPICKSNSPMQMDEGDEQESKYFAGMTGLAFHLRTANWPMKHGLDFKGDEMEDYILAKCVVRQVDPDEVLSIDAEPELVVRIGGGGGGRLKGHIKRQRDGASTGGKNRAKGGVKKEFKKSVKR